MIQLTTYKIFVSGPGETGSDMELVEQTISEANFITEPLGLRFQPFTWAEVTPGLSVEPQARINEQADGFDALVSIIGSRLGTPTAGYMSGTVEEIEKAIIAADKSLFGDDSVMVFFKNVDLDMASPHLSEAVKVQTFRSDLGRRKVLYKQFKDDDSLREAILRSLGRLIWRHLNSALGDISPATATASGEEHRIKSIHEPDVAENECEPLDSIDDGILDLVIDGGERMNIATERTISVSTAISSFGIWLKEFNENSGNLSSISDALSARDVISSVADQMDLCSTEINRNIDEVYPALELAFGAFERAAELQMSDLNADSRDQVQGLHDSVSELLQQVSGAEDGTRSMYDQLKSTPRLTSRLNQSKRSLMLSLEKVLRSSESISSRATETLNVLSAVLS